MRWNWQQKNWPNFSYDKEKLDVLEAKFLLQSGLFFGAYKHINDDDRQILTIDLISDEALQTSEIEGEYLNRDSLQSSILRQFGLTAENRKVPPAEQGIAEMMVDLYQHFAEPLTNEVLFTWHKMLSTGRRDLTDIGRYRTHSDPMQVISGPIHNPNIHFEAPPSNCMANEMKQFIKWFNATAPGGKTPLPALTRASMAHLYFVSIHPFEDGNGRIGRAISEKAMAQNIDQPTLISLSRTIQDNKKVYYDMLEKSNKKNEITEWLTYFSETVLQAQKNTEKHVDFLIEKTKLFDRLRDQLNKRQEKAILRMYREGPNGFTGGLSAENYISITNASRATATRDLQGLVGHIALRRTGERKGTRYWLNTNDKTLKFQSGIKIKL